MKPLPDDALVSTTAEGVGRHRLPTALVIHEAIRLTGEHELRRTAGSLLASGAAAGLTMGLSLLAAGLVRTVLPPSPGRDLASGLAMSLGFLVVMVGRQGLITENSLSAVLPILSTPSLSGVRRLFRLFALLITGNLAGASLFAAAASSAPLFAPDLRAAFIELGRHAVEPAPDVLLLRAIPAGWLVALALWTSPAAGTGRIVLIALLTGIVGAAGLPHVVTGSVEALTVVFAGELGVASYAVRFLAPVLLGNLVGGSVFVAVLSHLQVREERRKLVRARVERERGASRPVPRGQGDTTHLDA